MSAGSESQKRTLLRDLQVSMAAVVALGLALYVLLDVAMDRATRASPVLLISFIPSAVLCFAALLSEMRRRPYSLHLMHLLAVSLLLVLAPLVQLSGGSFPGGIRVSDNQILWGNGYVFLWLCGYVGASVVLRKSSGGVFNTIPWLEAPLTLSRLRMGCVIGGLSLGYLAYRGTAWTTTRAAFGRAFAAQSTLDMVSTVVFRGIPILVLAAWLLLLVLLPKRRTWVTYSVAGVLIVANLVINNPLAAARIWTLTVVLAVACIVYLRRRQTAALFIPGAIVGLTVMPILNVGRARTEFDLQALQSRAFRGQSDSLSSGDFDAFANLLLTDRLVTEQGITWGRQLMGAVLFWIPRRIWPGKPVGSGSYVAEELRLPWGNISSPLPAEALINFGVWGIVPCAVAFACLLHLGDRRYYLNRASQPPDAFRLLDVLYPFWLGLTVFATRGDLINSFTFSVGLTLSAVVALGIFGSRWKPPRNTNDGLPNEPVTKAHVSPPNDAARG